MGSRILTRAFLPLLVAALSAGACGPGGRGEDSGGSDSDGDGLAACGDGCPADQVCVPDLGCRACIPDQFFCGGPSDAEEIWQCNADGTGSELYMECPETQACLNGICLGACDAAEGDPSSVGCHFFAVDLDNEAADVLGVFENDAAAQQFAVVIANAQSYEVGVTVYTNTAPFGQPVVEAKVAETTIPANGLVTLDLPQREVDGTMGQNGAYVRDSGSGTFVSSHAFRIETTAPVVAYQFQPIIQQFSNDASLLLPRQALGRHYTVLGWPTSNPCGAPPGDPLYMQSIPDHTFVTIVGVHEDTKVKIVPSHPVMASGGPSGLAIPETPAGTPIEVTIGPYDVVNLESLQFVGSLLECLSHTDQDGDFSGSTIVSDKPIAVFSGNERGSGHGGAEPPMPPGWEEGDTCCTDHLEEQLLPVEALGWKFAISRSPVRSTHATYEEPDLYRVLATVDGTTVNTSLPAPFDTFTLNASEWKTFHAYGGFTIESTGGAIMVGQYLVSQETVPGGIGDPTFTIFPAADQHRDHYVFLVPTTFSMNYMVLALPVSASFELDGQSEFPPACEERTIGSLGGVAYRQVTCPLDEGIHRVRTSEPAGLTVYGYYTVGSYGYPGGSDVDIINPVQ